MSPLIDFKLFSLIVLICLTSLIPVKSHPCSETRNMKDINPYDVAAICWPKICECFTLGRCAAEFADLDDGIAMLWYFQESDKFEIDCYGFTGNLFVSVVNNKQFLLLRNGWPQNDNKWLRPTRQNYFNMGFGNIRFNLKLHTKALYDISFEPLPWNDDEMGVPLLFETSISLTIFEQKGHSDKKMVDNLILDPMGGPELTQKRGYFQIPQYIDNDPDPSKPPFNFYRVSTMGVTLANDFYIRQNEVIPRIRLLNINYYMCIGRTFRSDNLTEWTSVGCRPVREWGRFSKQYISSAVNGDYFISCECDFDSLGVKYPNNPLDTRTQKEIDEQNPPYDTGSSDGSGGGSNDGSGNDTAVDSGNDTTTELSSESKSKTSGLAVNLTIIFAVLMSVVFLLALITGISLIVYFKVIRNRN